MRLSNILALLLAPIALAHPIASPDSISISQRDGASSPIQARHQALSARIMKAVDESQELTDMCQKYNGGMSQSFDLYRQFKKCYKSVEHAEHGAKESEPFDESESEKVKEALATLTEKFVQISKYIQDRKEMIRGSRYKNYMGKELEKLRGRVGSFYDSCGSKASSSHKPDIKGYGKTVDSEFATVKNEILGKSKTRRSLFSRSDEEEFEGPVERFHFPHFHIPGSFNPRSTEEKPEKTEERFQFPGLPGFPDIPTKKRSIESDSEDKETKEHFHFPGFPDIPGFPSTKKRSIESDSEDKETKEHFHFPGFPDIPGFPSAKKRSIESDSEDKETKEHFHFPGFPDIPGFPSAKKRSIESDSEDKETKEHFHFPGFPDIPGFPSAKKRSIEPRSEDKETEENFQFPGFPDIPGFPSAKKRSIEPRSEDKETEEHFQFPGFPDIPGFPSAEKRSLEVRSEGEETEEPVERFHLPWAKRNEEFFKMLPALFEGFLSSDSEHGDNEGMFPSTRTGVPFEKGIDILKALMKMVSTHSCKSSGCQNGCETGQNEYGNGQYEYENGQNDYQNEENEFGNGQYEYENGQSGQKTSCQNKSQVKNFLQLLMDKFMRIGDAKKSFGMNQSEEK
ncbi:hypothetical protein MFRU_029g00510 [Monilinia fructicola]|nr:hypothetical protein MFRU_029g00510 [Monilinia fructicola]